MKLNIVKTEFTFRDVVKKLHLESSNEMHWAVGRTICTVAKEHGIEPRRILTKKTDPDPKVPAPHCIGHYPMALFPEVVRRVSERLRGE